MKSNALLKTLGFLALAATPVVAGTAPAPKNPMIAPAPANDDLGITASLGYDTNYVWRGVNYGQHWVRSAIDGSILLIGGASEDGAGSTSLLWHADYGSLAGDHDSFQGQTPLGFGVSRTASFQRLQVGAAVEHDFGAFALSLGYSYIHNMGSLANGGGLNGNPFAFPFTSGMGMNDIQQLTLGLKTKVGIIDVASSANIDLVNGGWYFDLNASSTFAVTDSISIVPSANVGYGLGYNYGLTQASRALFWGTPGVGNRGISGFTAATFAINFPIKLNSRATLTPYIACNVPMGPLANMAGNMRQRTATPFGLPDTAFKSLLYGGVTLSVRF